MTSGARQTPPRASASSSRPTQSGTRCPRGVERVARSSPRATEGLEKWSPPGNRDRTRLIDACSNGWPEPRGRATRLFAAGSRSIECAGPEGESRTRGRWVPCGGIVALRKNFGICACLSALTREDTALQAVRGLVGYGGAQTRPQPSRSWFCSGARTAASQGRGCGGGERAGSRVKAAWKAACGARRGSRKRTRLLRRAFATRKRSGP